MVEGTVNGDNIALLDQLLDTLDTTATNLFLNFGFEWLYMNYREQCKLMYR